jgi:hypothetical protein
MDNPKTLDDWLAAVTVDGGESLPMQFRGWHVVTLHGEPIALFPTWRAAYRFRLDYINRNLNPE